MCLQEGILCKAEQDIVCYKFIISRQSGWVAPYSKIEFPGLSTIASTRNPKFFTEGLPALSTVRHGIHSSANLRSVLEAISPGLLWDVNKQGSRDSYAKFKVLECKIPKGTYYYKGTWRGLTGYSSECLEYISEIFDSTDINEEKFVNFVNLVYGTPVNS